MDLPAELQTAPPRSAAGAERFLASNRKKLKGAIIGLVVLPPTLLFLGIVFPRITGWGLKGLDSDSAPWIAVIVDVFVALFVAVFYVQIQRSKKLFCEGIATLGTVTGIKAPDAGGSEATYFFLEIEYSDNTGKKYLGKATTTGNKIEAAQGSQVPLLYLPADAGKFAVYDSQLGMIPGVAKPG